MRMSAALVASALGACSCANLEQSPYSACLASYDPLPLDELTPLGFTAQEAIDLHGLQHLGILSWEFIEDVTYPITLPRDTEFQLELSPDEVLWGHYQKARGASWESYCPEEGLEIRVSGRAVLPDLGLNIPVAGHLTAYSSFWAGSQEVEVVYFDVSRALSTEEVAPFLQTLEDFRDGEGFGTRGLTASLLFSVGASASWSEFRVVWHQRGADNVHRLPIAPVLTLNQD